MIDDDTKPRFKVGETYGSNRRGEFTVLSIDGDHMRIRWDNGEEMICPLAEQEKILKNYEAEVWEEPVSEIAGE